MTFQGVATTRTEDPAATSTPKPAGPEPEATDGSDTLSGLSSAAKGGITAGVAIVVLGILLILFILSRRRMKSASGPGEGTPKSGKGNKPGGAEVLGVAELNGEDTRYIRELDSDPPRVVQPIELDGISSRSELPTLQYRGHEGGTTAADTADGPSRR